MKRIEYNRYGGPELMHLATFNRPLVGPSDILLEVKAASINPVDWGIRRGKMKILTGASFPRAMGKDVAGVIVEVGKDVVGWKVGDAVFGCVPWKRAGSFAPVALVHGRDIVEKPSSLSFSQAAALPTVGLTAWHGLVQGAKIKRGQSLLVNGAAGGVGTAVVQIAQALGVRITARVGARSFPRMTGRGVSALLDYREPLPADLDHNFDVVFDCNGSMSSGDLDRMLKQNGVAVDIAIKFPKLIRSLFLSRQKLAFGSVDQATLRDVAHLAGSGRLTMDISAEVHLGEAIPMLAKLEAGESSNGKVVIIFN